MIATVSSALLAVAIAFTLGGWPWALILAFSCLVAISQLNSLARLASFTVLSLCWLGAYLVTEDRRLFFPFTIQLAMQLYAFHPIRTSRWAAPVGVVLLFSVIRLIQAASLIVLAVEVLVAAVALVIGAMVFNRIKTGTMQRMLAAAIASFLAFAGLIF